MRCYKTVNDSYIEPVSFIVPRRAEVFQNDIYPPATGAKPSMTSDEYFSGKQATLPPKIAMESLYDGQTPVEVPAEQVPKPAQVKATPAPLPESKPAAKTEPTPQPSASAARSPVGSGSIKENQQSMAAAASKFADDEESSSDDDGSSFKEVSKSVERPHAVTSERQEDRTGTKTPPRAETVGALEPTKTSSAPAPAPAEPVKSSSVEAARETTPTAKGAAEGIKGALQDIKAMVAAQSEQIATLTQEVAKLKAKMGDD